MGACVLLSVLLQIDGPSCRCNALLSTPSAGAAHPLVCPPAPCCLRAAGAHLRFRDLVGGKNVKAERRQQRVAAAGRFALETALFGALWYAWTALQPQQL